MFRPFRPFDLFRSPPPAATGGGEPGDDPDHLLLESGSAILLESGDLILLESA
jgi:hypothetical protein